MRFYVGENERVSEVKCDNADLFEELYTGYFNIPAREEYNSVMRKLVEHPLVLFKHPAIEKNEFVSRLRYYTGLGTQTAQSMFTYIEQEDMYAVVVDISLGSLGYYIITSVGLPKSEIDSAIRKCMIDEFLEV